jgi:diaminopimelate decarboxylase
MTAFTYRDGTLCAEQVPLADIARLAATPVYVYSAEALRSAYGEFADAFADLGATVCYAVKANHNLAVLRLLGGLGAGMDVVSEGEMRRALAAGIPARRIVFSGVGKTKAEMAAALTAGIMQFNVESAEELAMLDEVAGGLGLRAPVALRVNPDVDAETHTNIATGRKTDKFGIDWERVPAIAATAQAMAHVDLCGIAVHIGSQLLGLDPYRAAFARVAGLIRQLRVSGIDIRRFDVGGGLGIAYREGEVPPSIADYAAVVRDAVGDLDLELVVEPGRRIVGPAGVLLASVTLVKETPERRFVIVDAAMNDLIRPMLYEAWHPIWPVSGTTGNAETGEVDVVGPICESTDSFAVQRSLPPVAAGDLLAFGAAGAYGAVMASEYNARPLVPEVLVDGDRWSIIRRRPTFDDMLILER